MGVFLGEWDGFFCVKLFLLFMTSRAEFGLGLKAVIVHRASAVPAGVLTARTAISPGNIIPFQTTAAVRPLAGIAGSAAVTANLIAAVLTAVEFIA